MSLQKLRVQQVSDQFLLESEASITTDSSTAGANKIGVAGINGVLNNAGGDLQDWLEDLVPGIGDPVKDILTLTQTNIDNKFVELSGTPLISGTVSLTPTEGIPQRFDVDYIAKLIPTPRVDWNGLDLDGILEVGETIVVDYLKKKGV